MPTSQWEDKDVGLGFTSIYNTGGNVGVGTEDPRTTFQVGNNVDAGEKGVGISSVGNINMTGILTATSLIGNLTGDVTGNISSDTVVSGIATFNNRVDINGQTELQNTIVTGFVTFFPTGGTKFFTTVDAKGDLDVDGHTELDYVNVSAASTFAGFIDANAGANVAGGFVANSAKISDLTAGRVPVVGTDGELEDASTFTFSGGTVTALGFSGDITGVGATFTLSLIHI